MYNKNNLYLVFYTSVNQVKLIYKKNNKNILNYLCKNIILAVLDT